MEIMVMSFDLDEQCLVFVVLIVPFECRFHLQSLQRLVDDSLLLSLLLSVLFAYSHLFCAEVVVEPVVFVQYE